MLASAQPTQITPIRAHHRVQPATSGAAFQTGDLPYQSPMPVGQVKAAPINHVQHRLGRVCEGPEGPACEPEHGVLRCQHQSAAEIARRMAEYEQATSVISRGTQQPWVVRVAAHHPMQYNDVGSLNLIGRCSDVEHSPVNSPNQSRLGGEFVGRCVIGVDELEVGGTGGASVKELQLDLPNTTTDLQDGGAIEPSIGEEVHHTSRGWVETALPVAPCLMPSEGSPEDFVAPTRIATSGHQASIPVVSRIGTCQIPHVGSGRH
jgi:hypothetical protein